MAPKVKALSLKDIVLHEMKNDSRYKDLLSVHRPKQLARYTVAEALTCNIQPRFLVLSGLQPETSRVRYDSQAPRRPLLLWADVCQTNDSIPSAI